MLKKKQVIVATVLAVIIGVWLTAVSPMLTVNYVKTPSELSDLEFGLPFGFLVQDCSAMDGTELIPQYPIALKLSDPIKYPVRLIPLRLALSAAINLIVPFVLFILLILLFNLRARRKERKRNKEQKLE